MHYLIHTVILTAAITSTALSTLAQAMTGNELNAACANGDPGTATSMDFGMCYGYVQGAVDGINAWHQLLIDVDVGGDVVTIPDAVRPPCVPATATISQLTDVVKKHMAEHPEQLHYGGASLVLFALHDAFPCGEAK